MPLRNKIFLSIEDTVTRRANIVVNAKLADAIRQAGVLVSLGEFDVARELIDGLDVSQELFELEGFLRMKFIQSALFGASQLVEPEQATIINQPGLADPLDNMILQFNGVINGGMQQLKALGHKFIRAQEEDAVDVAVGDGIIKSWGGHVHTPVALFKNELSAKFQQAMMGNLNALVSISANLTISRVITYGFLIEASANGIVEFEVSEILDERTCPVCELMNGQNFAVERALARTAEIITVTDPAELRSKAPWPKQDAASLEELRALDSEDLQTMGFDTPPYHPFCRGIVVEVGRSISGVQQDIRPVGPGKIVQLPAGPKLIQPKPSGAAALVIEPVVPGLGLIPGEGAVLGEAAVVVEETAVAKRANLKQMSDAAGWNEEQWADAVVRSELLHTRSQLSALTSEDALAINMYTRQFYWNINKGLRGQKFEQFAETGPQFTMVLNKKITKQINDGLSKLEDFSGTVYRGASLPGGLEAMEAAVAKHYKVGTVITEKGFTSTSTERSSMLSGRIRFEIQSKTGKVVRTLSRHEHENEVLFRSGTKFKVLQVETEATGIGASNITVIRLLEII